MRRLLIFVGLLLACGDPPVVVTEGRLVVSAEELVFPKTFVGHSSVRTLELRNSGRASLYVSIQSETPFSVDVETRELGAGATYDLDVSFSPETPSSVAATLSLVAGNQRVEVRLAGEAVEAKVCEPSTECREIRLDPEVGCIELRQEDGTSCGGACFHAGICQDGVCVGEAIDCDDGNACTLDVCDPDLGCRHVEDALACEDGDDPCSSAACDPEAGCVSVPVADGVRCGPADCVHSMVCLAGTCQQVKTPEGGACGEESPCRPAGICQDGACVQPAPSPLVPAWTLRAQDGRALHFGGLNDPLGHLYWAECDSGGCSLARATAEGRILYRTPMFKGSPAPGARLMLADELVVSSFAPGYLEVFEAGSGAKIQRIDLAKELPGLPSQAKVELRELAGSGAVAYALLEAADEDEFLGAWVMALSLTTGRSRWSLPAFGSLEGLVLDEGGNLYLRFTAAGGGASHGIALTPEGGERWRVEASQRPHLAAARGALIGADGTIARLTDGGTERELPLMAPLFSRSALLAERAGFLFGFRVSECGLGVLCPDWQPYLFGFDTRDGLRWALPVASAEAWGRSEPILTAQGTVLFAEGNAAAQSCGGRSWLQELDAAGEVLMACELPAGGNYAGPAALSRGGWVIADTCNQSLQLYSLPDRETASKGWVTAHGGPARQSRPR